MRCSKCGLWVRLETVPATEEEPEYSAYLHYDAHTVCLCEGIEHGTYDGVGLKKDGKNPKSLLKSEKVNQMFAIDKALSIYYADGIGGGQTWLDVQKHDRGGQACNCSTCVVHCKICSQRKRILEKQK